MWTRLMYDSTCTSAHCRTFMYMSFRCSANTECLLVYSPKSISTWDWQVQIENIYMFIFLFLSVRQPKIWTLPALSAFPLLLCMFSPALCVRLSVFWRTATVYLAPIEPLLSSASADCWHSLANSWSALDCHSY